MNDDDKIIISNNLTTLFYIAMNIPARDIQEFLSGQSFSIAEAYEELKVSSKLLSLGYFKQSMVSLRIGMDIGLFSLYWSIKGIKSNEFRKWFSSKIDTPYKNDKFWNLILTNEYIKAFNDKFNLINELKTLNLSDYVHTKGKLYSNNGKTERILKSMNESEIWLKNFLHITQSLIILHLLRYPSLNIRYSTDFLISKFATTDSIPQCGCGLGDEMKIVDDCIPNDQRYYIEELVKEDTEIFDIKEWIENLPTLTTKEIKEKIMKESKMKIEHEGGFENWKGNLSFGGDKRIDSIMIEELERWAKENDLMTVESIIDKKRKQI